MPAAMTKADALRIKSGGVEVRSLTPLGTIPGVFIEHVSGNNGKGSGFIRSEGTNRLRWKAPGSSTFGAPHTVTGDGTFILEDGEDAGKYVRVQAYTNYFVAGSSEQRVMLDWVYNNAVSHTDVDADDAATFVTHSYSFEIENVSTETLRNVKVWTGGSLQIVISQDGLIFGLFSDEGVALTWSTITPGESKTVYVRRLVGVPVTPLGPDPLVLVEFNYAFDG